MEFRAARTHQETVAGRGRPFTSRKTTMKYSIATTTTLGYQQAITRVTEELKKEGFGVLTTIDVKDTMKKKLNVDIEEYVILGACNPPFAHKTLEAEPEIGQLLPCTVIVYRKGETTHVAAFDPVAMGAVVDNPAIQPIAGEVRERLVRVIAAL